MTKHNILLLTLLLLTACGSAGTTVGLDGSVGDSMAPDGSMGSDGSYTTLDGAVDPMCQQVPNARGNLTMVPSIHSSFTFQGATLSDVCVTDSEISFNADYTYLLRYNDGGSEEVIHPALVVSITDFQYAQECSVLMRRSGADLAPVAEDPAVDPNPPACALFSRASVRFSDEYNSGPIQPNGLRVTTTATGHGSYLVTIVADYVPHTYTFELEVTAP